MESITILVNGLCESAGKTTASLGLYRWLEELGKTYPFKPLAANDYWYDHGIISEGLEEGRVYGKDAKLLSDLVEEKEESVNPVHRIWAPESIAGSGAGIGGQNNSIILDRIADVDKTTLAVNSEVTVPGKLQSIFKKADEVNQFSDSSELDALTKNTHLPAIKNRLENIPETEFLILESYSDVSMPISMEFDVVLTVEPGRALISEGKRFSEAYSLIADKWGVYGREIGTRKVLKSLDPKIISLSPSPLKNGTEPKYIYEDVFNFIENNFLDK